MPERPYQYIPLKLPEGLDIQVSFSFQVYKRDIEAGKLVDGDNDRLTFYGADNYMADEQSESFIRSELRRGKELFVTVSEPTEIDVVRVLYTGARRNSTVESINMQFFIFDPKTGWQESKMPL